MHMCKHHVLQHRLQCARMHSRILDYLDRFCIYAHACKLFVAFTCTIHMYILRLYHFQCICIIRLEHKPGYLQPILIHNNNTKKLWIRSCNKVMDTLVIDTNYKKHMCTKLKTHMHTYTNYKTHSKTHMHPSIDYIYNI